MGQQGGWHKGMPGQGCPVTARSERSTSGAKAPRHARREDRQASGPNRWRPPQACAAPGPNGRRPPLPLQQWAQYAGDIRQVSRIPDTIS